MGVLTMPIQFLSAFVPPARVTDRGLTTIDAIATSVNTMQSPSFSPAANARLVVVVGGYYQNALPPTFTLSDTFTGTGAWTEVVTQSAVGFNRISIWTAVCGATPGAGTITASRAAGTGDTSMSANFLECPSGSTIGATGNAVSAATVTSLALTLSATPNASSIVIGGALDDGGTGALTQPSGWTELRDVSMPNNGEQFETAFIDGSSATTLTWTTFTGNPTWNKYVVAVEIVNNPPASVAGFFSNLHQGTTTGSVTGISWQAGDTIVFMAGIDGDNHVPAGVPTNANLTFGASLLDTGSGTTNHDQIVVYKATAASSQTAQTISQTYSSTPSDCSQYVWVLRGVSGTVGSTATTIAMATGGSTFSQTVSVGSIGLYAHADFNANASPRGTPLTGSGTVTERVDDANANSGSYAADWVGTAAGTFTFGMSTYAGSTCAAVFIEFLD